MIELSAVATQDLVRELKARGVYVFVGTMKEITGTTVPSNTGDKLMVAVIAEI